MSDSMNLGQLRSQVYSFLMNTSTDVNSLTWSASEINGYLNEGVLYTQQITQAFKEFDNIVCTASQATYTGPATAYQYIRLTWDRTFLPQTNEYELDRDDPSWRLASPNNPFRFYFPVMGQNFTIVPYPAPLTNGVNYAPFSRETGVVTQFLLADGITPDNTYTFSQELGVVVGYQDTQGAITMFRSDRIANPFTTTSAELGELVVYSTDELNIGLSFVRLPDTMVQDIDTPQLPVQCHMAVAFYALMRCFTREGEWQDMQLAKAWFDAYGDWMESVLNNMARWWPTRVKSLEPFEEGSLFAKRLFAVGYPMQLDLTPSY